MDGCELAVEALQKVGMRLLRDASCGLHLAVGEAPFLCSQAVERLVGLALLRLPVAHWQHGSPTEVESRGLEDRQDAQAV
jgi:hypothetical protein